MKRNDSFSLTVTDDTKYILPTGQALCDNRMGTRVNSSGEYIWGLLSSDISLEEIYEKAFEHFEAASAEDKEIIKKDVDYFLKVLKELDMLSPDNFAPYEDLNLISENTAGDCLFSFYGCPELFPDSFRDFSSRKDYSFSMRIELAYIPEKNNRTGKVILRNTDMMIMDCDDCFIFLFPAFPQIREALLSKDGALLRIISRAYKDESVKEEVFQAIRPAFLYNALIHGRLALHSSSVLYKDHIFLFSAYSGIGKSTHAGLWNTCFNVPILNGDLNLFGVKEGKPFVFGTPWCGTSGICSKECYPLGGIFFLERDSKNYVENIAEDKKIFLAWCRLITSAWNQNMLDAETEILHKIKGNCLMATLHTTPETGAAKVAKEAADNFLVF